MISIYKRQFRIIKKYLGIKKIISIRFSNTKTLNFKKYKDINSKNFAILISSLYKDFGNIKKNKIIEKTIKKTTCKEMFISDYKDKQYIKPVFDLKEFNQLSMGMSKDYKQAIAEGATMLRIGTDIFGARDYN